MGQEKKKRDKMIWQNRKIKNKKEKIGH